MPIWSHITDAFVLAAGDAQPPSLYTMLLPIVAIAVLFYFLILRPEKRKQSNIATMQDNLKKNDRVVTVGGIIGVVVNTQKGSPEVTLRIDDNNNTRIHVLRSAISRVLADEKSTGEEKKED